ncbi:MAG: hypothetical protein MUP16_11140 [Sedimentisphaerales bacterium]|nr:hypothetical protein [Sedimentisphaerales bacterium]
MAKKKGLNPILFCVIYAAIVTFVMGGPYSGVLDTFYVIVIGLLGSAAALSCFFIFFGERNDGGH